MRRGLGAALFICFCYPSYAQFLPDLQAKSTEEYDAYLAVQDGPILARGSDFERRFPDSSLRLPVCEWTAKEFRRNGQAAQAISAVERGLAIAPDYIPLLVEQADLLSNGGERLPVAAEAARRAIEFLQTAKAPQRVSPEDWKAATESLLSRAHSALGLIAFKRSDMGTAIREFTTAVGLDTPERAMAQYRLGRVYGLIGNRGEARKYLQAAMQGSDSRLREMARAALAAL